MVELHELERLVMKIQEAGQAWVEAKLKADQVDEDCKPYLAAIQNEMDDGKTSEAKLERLARGSKNYRDYIAAMCAARADMLRKKIRYESLNQLFDAKRSEKAFEREAIKRGIFPEGG